jgi:hypothetical protein
MKIEHNDDYRARRKAEYPNIGDQLDALWKFVKDGDLVVVQDMLTKITAVKQRYPKS